MKNFKKALCVILILVVSLFALSGCMNQTAETLQSQQTQQILNQVNQEIGMPNITNFYEKKMQKAILELRDNSDLICYAYVQSGISGKFIYLGKCMGFGLPYSVQYTNPSKAERMYTGGEYVTLPQADPNGLYMPADSNATWIMLINETTGTPEVMYCEPTTVVTQSKLPRRVCDDTTLPKDY